MKERLQFFLRKKYFLYNRSTGDGYAYVSYNILTDVVTLRRSFRGYVVGYIKEKRSYYEKLEGDLK